MEYVYPVAQLIFFCYLGVWLCMHVHISGFVDKILFVHMFVYAMLGLTLDDGSDIFWRRYNVEMRSMKTAVGRMLMFPVVRL